jgi:glycosyltransferase involved in cell wall biosynthesis
MSMTSIIILTHDQLEYTKRCIDSLRRWNDVRYELILVDNASTDGTVEYLKSLPASFNPEPTATARAAPSPLAPG